VFIYVKFGCINFNYFHIFLKIQEEALDNQKSQENVKAHEEFGKNNNTLISHGISTDDTSINHNNI
jgi:hypothetical protein